jgi:hypothetical protein
MVGPISDEPNAIGDRWPVEGITCRAIFATVSTFRACVYSVSLEKAGT